MMRPFLVLLLLALPLRADEPRLAPALKPFVDDQTLAGAVVLVSDARKTLAVEAVGAADRANNIPMTTDCLFWIASQNKPLTATLVMMLVDEGKVSLDDPVEKYLPEFKNQMVIREKSADKLVLGKPARPATVRDLLSHTAGLVGRSPLEKQLDSLSLRDGAITYGLSPLQFEPGSKWEYCNPGINTAGRIVEVVAGIPYEKFLQERLLDPLGMVNTTFWPDEKQLKRLAKSYKPGPNNMGLEEITISYLRYPLNDRTRYPYPGGGLFSTAEDVASFCRLILNGGMHGDKRLLNEESVRQMTSTQTGDLLNKGQGENGYGLGFSTSRKAREGAVVPGSCGHGGAFSTNMTIDPQTQRVTVFLVQHAGFPGPKGSGEKVRQAFEAAAREAFPKE